MTDKLISDLGSIGAAIADNTAYEVQRNGQTTSEQALHSDLKTYIKSWIAKTDVGLGNVTNNAQLTIANNLSDVASAVTSRINLGLAKFHPGYKSAKWIFLHGGSVAGGSAPGAGSIRLFPFIVSEVVTITDLAIRVTTPQAAENAQAALYAADATTLMATGNALSSTGNLSVASAANVSAALGANVTLQPSTLYWAATNCSHATPTFTSIVAGQTQFAGVLIGDGTLNNLLSGSSAVLMGYSVPQAFASGWPDLTSATFTGITTASIPTVMAKTQ